MVIPPDQLFRIDQAAAYPLHRIEPGDEFLRTEVVIPDCADDECVRRGDAVEALRPRSFNRSCAKLCEFGDQGVIVGDIAAVRLGDEVKSQALA